MTDIHVVRFLEERDAEIERLRTALAEAIDLIPSTSAVRNKRIARLRAVLNPKESKND